MLISGASRAGALAKKDVVGAFAGDRLEPLVAERAQVEALKEVLSAAQHHGPNREMEVVDEPGGQILADRGDAAAQAHIHSPGRGFRLLQRRLNSVGHEMKGGAALHRDRLARVVRQYERRDVIGRLVSPPSLPALVRPRAAHGSKHVSPQDPRSYFLETLFRHLVVQDRK